MAQSAGLSAQDNRSDMGKPVIWASASLDPPRQLKTWLVQFLMAVTVKEKVNLEIMLEDLKEIMEEPRRDQKNLEMGKDANAIAARELRDKLARYSIVLENGEREPEA